MSATKTAPAARSGLTNKELAKIGLAAGLGVLVATGLSRSRAARRLHVLAGGAFVGLSIWHHLLYAPAGNKKKGKTVRP